MDRCQECDGRGKWPVDLEKIKIEDPEQFAVLQSIVNAQSKYGMSGPITETCVACNETGSESMRAKLETERSSPLLHEYIFDMCPDIDKCRWCGEKEVEHKDV